MRRNKFLAFLSLIKFINCVFAIQLDSAQFKCIDSSKHWLMLKNETWGSNSKRLVAIEWIPNFGDSSLIFPLQQVTMWSNYTYEEI